MKPGQKQNEAAEDTGTESAKNPEMEPEHGEIPVQGVTLRGKEMQQPTPTPPAKLKIKHCEKLRSKSEGLMIYLLFPLFSHAVF